MNKKYIFNERQLKDAVRKSFSYANVLKILKMKQCGGTQEKIKKEIQFLKIDVSHFTGMLWSKGKHLVSTEDYLTNKKKINSSNLRVRLIKEGIKKDFCEDCKQESYFGRKIPLELHHLNGNKKDNRIENLKILCPICHAFTKNYRKKKSK